MEASHANFILMGSTEFDPVFYGAMVAIKMIGVGIGLGVSLKAGWNALRNKDCTAEQRKPRLISCAMGVGISLSFMGAAITVDPSLQWISYGALAVASVGLMAQSAHDFKTQTRAFVKEVKESVLEAKSSGPRAAWQHFQGWLQTTSADYYDHEPTPAKPE